MFINDKVLIQKKACPEQVAKFRAEWPDGGEVSEDGLLRATELGLDLDWFACNFLSAPLCAKYQRQTAPFLAEYQRQTAPLWAEYQRQTAPLCAEYQRKEAKVIWGLIK